MTVAQLIAGIDVGGTNTRVAVTNASAPDVILARRVVPTPAHQGADAFIAVVAEQIEACLGELGVEGRIEAIGCSTPGIVDADAGIVHLAVNLGWTDLPLASALTARFGVPARVENDVKAAAVGEYERGAGKGSTSLVYFTVSTGVSAGIIVGGKVLRGAHHAAGEIAYLLPERAHVAQTWSANGALEFLAGGIGLQNAWNEYEGNASGTATAEMIFAAAEAGNEVAVELVARAADYLAQAAVAIGSLIDPEVLVLGGSIAQHQPRVFNHIREVTERMLPFPPRVVPAALEGNAPLTGALLLAAKEITEERTIRSDNDDTRPPSGIPAGSGHHPVIL